MYVVGDALCKWGELNCDLRNFNWNKTSFAFRFLISDDSPFEIRTVLIPVLAQGPLELKTRS